MIPNLGFPRFANIKSVLYFAGLMSQAENIRFSMKNLQQMNFLCYEHNLLNLLEQVVS